MRKAEGGVKRQPLRIPNPEPRPRRGGFTLIELLVSLAVLSILGGVDAAILNAGVDSWTYAQGRLALQQVANDLLEMLLEGGYDREGLKDAIELRDAGVSAISFVPLWTDATHTPDSIHNRTQQFTLDKQFRPGAVTPVGQLRKRETNEWLTVPVSFKYGEGRDPKKPDDVVTFTEPIPPGSAVKLLYTPDAEAHPEVQMRFSWNAGDGQLYYSYAGQTAPALRRTQGVRLERLAFLYYDNLNRLLPLKPSYTSAELKRMTGVKLYLLLVKGDQWKELTSFTNIRNVQTIGVTIARGAILPLPMPKAIKAFSLGDFYGLRKEGIVELVVRTNNAARWKIRLEFAPASKPDQLILRNFKIEAPPGTIRTSGILDQAIGQNEFVNLLTVDRTGLFDYDEDQIAGELLIKGSRPIVEVARCDFEVASLFIRP